MANLHFQFSWYNQISRLFPKLLSDAKPSQSFSFEDARFSRFRAIPPFSECHVRLLPKTCTFSKSKRPKSANKISLHCSLCTPESYGIFFGKTILHVVQLLSYKHVSGKKLRIYGALLRTRRKLNPGSVNYIFQIRSRHISNQFIITAVFSLLLKLIRDGLILH